MQQYMGTVPLQVLTQMLPFLGWSRWAQAKTWPGSMLTLSHTRFTSKDEASANTAGQTWCISAGALPEQ